MSATRRAAAALLIGVAAAGVHLGALDCGFIAYDDDAYIYRNPHLRQGFTPDSLRWAVTAHLTHDALPHLDYWQPLTVLSRLLDVELYGLSPRGHHATNVALHGMNAALLFLALEAMTGAPWRSAFVSALFGLHPLRVESVVWVTERKDVLSGLFWMLTLAAYLRFVRTRERRDYALVLAAFVLGLMAKPILVTLPFVLLLLDYWPLRRLGPRDWRTLRALALEKAPLFAFAAASLAITVISHARGAYFVGLEARPLSMRVGTALVDYARAATRIAWPQPMALPQPFPLTASPAAVVVACGAALAIVSAAAWIQRDRRPWLAVGWLWFLGTLAPTIALVSSGAHPLADRFTYIPHIGLGIAITWGLAEIVPASARMVLWGTAAAALAASAFATVAQARHWRDSETLFRHAVAVTTDNFDAHFNLGNALAEKGRGAEAIDQYRKTIALHPRHARAHNNLANLLGLEGRIDAAIVEYEAALRLQPDYGDAHSNLGLLHARKGDDRRAREHLAAALRAKPRHADALYNMGRLEERAGRSAEALDLLTRAVSADPDFAAAFVSRGNLLAQSGRLQDAERDYREALRLRPSDADAANNLGRALELQGRTAEAMAAYEEAVRLAPGRPLPRLNIGHLQLSLGRHEDACASYREALRVDPAGSEAAAAIAANRCAATATSR